MHLPRVLDQQIDESSCRFVAEVIRLPFNKHIVAIVVQDCIFSVIDDHYGLVVCQPYDHWVSHIQQNSKPCVQTYVPQRQENEQAYNKVDNQHDTVLYRPTISHSLLGITSLRVNRSLLGIASVPVGCYTSLKVFSGHSTQCRL